MAPTSTAVAIEYIVLVPAVVTMVFGRKVLEREIPLLLDQVEDSPAIHEPSKRLHVPEPTVV